MILVIAEKPSVGAAIGKVLGATSRKDGYPDREENPLPYVLRIGERRKATDCASC